MSIGTSALVYRHVGIGVTFFTLTTHHSVIADGVAWQADDDRRDVTLSRL